MLFKYKYTSPPVYPAGVVLKATPTEGRTGKPWERTLEQMNIGSETDLINKREVFCLTDW